MCEWFWMLQAELAGTAQETLGRLLGTWGRRAGGQQPQPARCCLGPALWPQQLPCWCIEHSSSGCSHLGPQVAPKCSLGKLPATPWVHFVVDFGVFVLCSEALYVAPCPVTCSLWQWPLCPLRSWGLTPVLGFHLGPARADRHPEEL